MVQKELQELWTRLNRLGSEFEGRLAKMRQEMLTVNTQPRIVEQPQHPLHETIGQSIDQGAQQTVQQAAAVPAQDHVGRQAGSGNDPRSGGYSENDVSVEKFFYCGTR
jgi:hypothetical protein